MFWAEMWKISELFIWKFSVFEEEIFYLFEYRHVLYNVYFVYLFEKSSFVTKYTCSFKSQRVQRWYSGHMQTAHHENMPICLYNFDPNKPHFYILKLGFTGVYFIFLIFARKHRLWILVRTAVLTSTLDLCFEQKYEKYQNISMWKIAIFWW